MPIRLLGDAVLQRRAWELAEQLDGLHYNAEYVHSNQFAGRRVRHPGAELGAQRRGIVATRLLTALALAHVGHRPLMVTLGGEVSVADLDARRGAGTALTRPRRGERGRRGRQEHPGLFRLCAWNAFALQTIADTLIAATQPLIPRPRLRPRPTLSYASACLDAVPSGIRQAVSVISDPAARIAAICRASSAMAADEPTNTSSFADCARPYEALQLASRADLEPSRGGTARSRAVTLAHLRRVCAEMASNADYANALDLRTPGRSIAARCVGACSMPPARIRARAVARAADTRRNRARARRPRCPGSNLVGRILATDRTCWPVLDRTGVNLGLVQRRRVTGRPVSSKESNVDTSLSSTTLHIPPEAIAAIAQARSGSPRVGRS